MLHQSLFTIPAEIQDFPEWHHGRETYGVWVLHCEGNKSIQEKFNAARKHLNGYLLEPYKRQPHITLFVCGFLVDEIKYNDDFELALLQVQIKTLEKAIIEPFDIEIGGLNSFASAPFLEVYDPTGGIAHLRDILSRGGREFRTAPYTPHLTVGLYGDVFSSSEIVALLGAFPKNPIKWKVDQITLATYQAQEFAGPLTPLHKVTFHLEMGD